MGGGGGGGGGKANVCKGQFKEFLFYSLQVQCVLRLLLCAHRSDIRLRAKHFAPKDVFALAVRIRSFQLLRVTGSGGR